MTILAAAILTLPLAANRCPEVANGSGADRCVQSGNP